MGKMIFGMERRNAAIFIFHGLKMDGDRSDREMDALTLFEKTSYVVTVGSSAISGYQAAGDKG